MFYFSVQSNEFTILISKLFPSYQELNVVHNYLISNAPNVQARIRKSGQAGNWAYSYAVRQYNENGQSVETRRQVDRRAYAVSSLTQAKPLR